jgi:hypothetical protein
VVIVLVEIDKPAIVSDESQVEIGATDVASAKNCRVMHTGDIERNRRLGTLVKGAHFHDADLPNFSVTALGFGFNPTRIVSHCQPGLMLAAADVPITARQPQGASAQQG